MSEDLLSALLDGECTPDEVKRLLDQAEASPELGRRWSRMCAARDAMAGTRVRQPAPDFCAGVMAAIAAPAPAAAKSVVTPIRARPAVQPVRRRRSARWQPWAGMAVAASVATMAVLGAHSWLQQGPGPLSVAANSRPATGTATPVAAAEPAEIPWGKLDAAAARQLNDLVLEHSSMRADQGMVGPLNYARMAVRTADYQPGEQR
jgi:sigma-E factor negative regulatory protein RseA